MGIRRKVKSRANVQSKPRKKISVQRDFKFDIVDNHHDLFSHLRKNKEVIYAGELKSDVLEWFMFLNKPKMFTLLHEWPVNDTDLGKAKIAKSDYVLIKSKLAKFPKVNIINMEPYAYCNAVENQSVDIIFLDVFNTPIAQRWFTKLSENGMMVFNSVDKPMSSIAEAEQFVQSVLVNTKQDYHIRYMTFEKKPTIAIQKA